MQKIILLLIALTIAPWAKTWTQFLGGYNGALESETEVSSLFFTTGAYLYFDTTGLTYSLDLYDNIENVRILFDDVYYGGNCYATSGDNEACSFRMFAYDIGHNLNDSIWVQKNRNEFIFNDSLDLHDTSLFTIPLMKEDYPFTDDVKYGFLLDDYSLTNSGSTSLDSIYFVYKKDSSYYAYCLYVQSEYCFSFLFQCEFQDDGTTRFDSFSAIGEYPYKAYDPESNGTVTMGSKCLTKSEYEDYLSPIFTPAHRKVQTAKMNSVPYQINGSRSRGGASSVIIRDGRPNLELRK